MRHKYPVSRNSIRLWQKCATSHSSRRATAGYCAAWACVNLDQFPGAPPKVLAFSVPAIRFLERHAYSPDSIPVSCRWNRTGLSSGCRGAFRGHAVWHRGRTCGERIDRHFTERTRTCVLVSQSRPRAGIARRIADSCFTQWRPRALHAPHPNGRDYSRMHAIESLA